MWPGFVATYAGGLWVLSREGIFGHAPGWALVGIGVGDAGVVVLLLVTLLAWLAKRRPGAGKLVAVISGLYLVALGVAWFAMSVKPGS